MKGDLAKADAHRLLGDHERQLSSRVRRLEDTVMVKKKLLEVDLQFYSSMFLCL